MGGSVPHDCGSMPATTDARTHFRMPRQRHSQLTLARLAAKMIIEAGGLSRSAAVYE